MSSFELVTLQSDGTRVLSQIDVSKAAKLIAPIWQKNWGHQRDDDKRDIWGESVACQSCYAFDQDAPSVSAKTLIEGSNVFIPAIDVFRMLTQEQRNIICQEPDLHEDAITHYWSEGRTQAYLEGNDNQRFIIVAQSLGENQDLSPKVLGWFLEVITTSDELNLAGLGKGKELHYLDTLGYDTHLGRRDKMLAVNELGPVIKASIRRSLLARRPVIFRTHKDAKHVKDIAQSVCDIEKLADSEVNSSREYYRLRPTVRKTSALLIRSFKKNILIKTLANPSKTIPVILKEVAESSSNSEDPKEKALGLSTLEYLEASKGQFNERAKDLSKDVRVCASLVFANIFYLAGIASLATLSRDPISVSLASFEGATALVPVVGGMSGIVRSVYLLTRAGIYAKKYNESFAPKMMTALISALDGGWILSPLVALGGENPVNKLIVFKAKKKLVNIAKSITTSVKKVGQNLASFSRKKKNSEDRLDINIK